MTLSVAQGKQYCEVFRIPTAWATPIEYWQRFTSIEYRWPVNTRTEIMISPPPRQEADHLRPTGRMAQLYKYRFALTLPVRLKPVTEDEWMVGSYAELWPGHGEYTDDMLGGESHAVPPGYREKKWLKLAPFLPRSGNIWSYYTPALLSPGGGNYLVLQSWNGWRDPQGATSNFAELFLDIYRWPSKAVVAKIVGNSGAWLPESVLDQTHWLTNNDLIMAFDDVQGFLYCHITD